jgi:hypothetical protein
MSNVVYLEVVNVQHHEGSPALQSDRPTVYMHEIETGEWVVHDQSALRGGCFRDHASAYRYVAEEFGPDSGTVIHPYFPPMAEQQARSQGLLALTAR